MNRSEALFSRAQQCLSGGVNSPVRAFGAVGGTPKFIQAGDGAYLQDVDGNRYIDYVGSWGPLILGHAHPAVIKAVSDAIKNGLSFGAPTELEVQLAEKVCELIPAIEMLRMVNSGTEATMTAIRLARGYTQRDYIIKFEGCYHGHNDALLVKAGSGGLTFDVPTSAGVPKDFIKYTLTADFNDLTSVQKLFQQYPNKIAGVILEPIAGNMNCIPAQPEFIQGLQALCQEHKTLLIFDEVMTGFRVALGGAQELYKVTPDLTTLGKIIGGGMPVGAIGGRKDIMEHLTPLGSVYQAGTLSGNPIAMAAGLANLEQISQTEIYPKLNATTIKLCEGLVELARAAEVPLTYNQVGSMFGLFFTTSPQVTNFNDVMQTNLNHFKQFFHGMLQHGVNFAPSAYEAGFVSIAHTDHEIAATLNAAQQVFATIK